MTCIEICDKHGITVGQFYELIHPIISVDSATLFADVVDWLKESVRMERELMEIYSRF